MNAEQSLNSGTISSLNILSNQMNIPGSKVDGELNLGESTEDLQGNGAGRWDGYVNLHGIVSQGTPSEQQSVGAVAIHTPIAHPESVDALLLSITTLTIVHYLCSSRIRMHPRTTSSPDSEVEGLVAAIIGERKRGRDYQYLVRWDGEGPENNLWLPRSELKDCEVFNKWLASKGRS